MTVENTETGRRMSVIIPTTLGPVAITALIELTGEGGRSSMCLDGTVNQIGIASGYNAFVRCSTGVIHRLFGKTPLVNYRLDVSDNVEAGASWQLAVLVAHALWTDGKRLDTGKPPQGPLVWATGAISPVDFAVGSVGHVGDKLRNSRDLFEKALAAGRAVHIFVPQENERDIEPDIATWLSEKGLRPVLLTSADAALAALGLPAIPRAASHPDDAPTTVAGNPYRGLQSYQREHRALFFGRARAREEALEQLRVAAGHGRPFLLVHGQSGVGKSSLVQAGLAADVEEYAHEGGRFRSAVVTPSQGGDNPIAALCHGLRAMLDPSGAETGEKANTAEAAVALLETLRSGMLSGSKKQSGLLIIDQLEEIFEPTIIPERAVEFGDLIERIVGSRVIWVVCTMRADALGQLDRVPALAHLASPDRVYRLDRPSRFELSEIVAAPAALAGKTFPDRTIPESFADIAAASPDSLPLLQSVLYLFFDQADEKGQLTAEGLKRIGGFEGAVGRWADQVRGDIIRNGAAPDLVDRVLVSLVRIEPETRRPLARSVPYEPESDNGQVLRQLSAARLVSLFDGTHGPRARLAHEVLATHWPHLAGLVEKLGAAIILRDDIEARTRAWLASGREEAELLRGPARLDAAQTFLRDALVPFEPAVSGYVEASAAAAQEEARKAERLAKAELERARVERDAATEKSHAARRFQWLMAGASIMLAGFAAFAGWQWLQAIDAREAAVIAAESEKKAAEAATAAAKRADEQAEKAVTAEAAAKQQLQAARINEARFIAGRAEQMKAENLDLARLALLEILPDSMQGDETRPLVPEAISALASINTAKLPSLLQPNIMPIISRRIFSPDWRFMVSAFSTRYATVNDTRTGVQFGVIPAGETDIVQMQVNPDGRHVTMTTYDGITKLWDTQPIRAVKTVSLREGGGITTTRFNAAGDKAVTVSRDGVIRIWDGMFEDTLDEFPMEQAAGMGRPVFPAYGDIASLTPDGTRIVYSSLTGDDKLYNVETGDLMTVFNGRSASIDGPILSRDGQLLVNAGKDNVARVWDTNSGRLVRPLEGHAKTVGGAFFTADDTHIITYSEDGSARSWDTGTGAQVMVFTDQSGPVFGATISRDGKTLVTWSQDKILRLWDVRTGKVKQKIAGHPSGFNMAVFSPDDLRLATSSGQFVTEIWDIDERGQARTLSSTQGTFARIATSSDAQMVLATTYKPAGGYKVDIVDAAGGQVIRTLVDTAAEDRQGIGTTAFSPDGTRIAISTSDGKIQVWDMATGGQIKIISDFVLMMMKPVLSPDNRQVAALTNFNVATIRDIESGAEIARLLGHTAPLSSVSFSPDGKRVVTTANDNTVRIWNASDGKPGEILKNLPVPALDAIFSPDGQKVLIISTDYSVRIWDVNDENRSKIVTIQGWLDVFSSSGHSMGFSSDSRRAAIISPDRSVRIFDTQTGTPLRRVPFEDASPVVLGYGRNGIRIGSISPTQIRVSELDLGISQEDLLAREHLLPHRLLTEAERSDLFPDSDVKSTATRLAEMNRCDVLAANPADIHRAKGPSVEFGGIPGWQAVGACNEALQAEPDNARFRYQLGRAYASLNQHSQALEAFRKAADRGYGMAFDGLGFAYEHGLGVPVDLAMARQMYEKAVEAGAPTALVSLSAMAQYGAGESVDPVKAKALVEKAAELGVSNAHQQLAQMAETGSPVNAPDLEVALFHYAALTVLYEDYADDGLAARTRMRRGALAHLLPADRVAVVWERLREWRKSRKPKP